MDSNNPLGEQSPNPVVRKDEGRVILQIQSGLAIAATRRKDKQFHNLHSLLWRREWLNQALEAVLDNTGAKTSGVDGVCGTDLHEPSARARFVEELRTELRQHTYRPSSVLRKYIPKANGKERPIGIPTIRDRVVQMVLKMVLEPIFEADFLPNSNGFRPERSTLECVLPMYRYGDNTRRYEWVIEGDIEGCFDNIDHGILMEAVQKRIADNNVLWLIRRFLKAPVIDEGIQTKTHKGTPQGGVLSPLLANIYLNEFDQFWHENWGKLTAIQKSERRKKGQASCVLFRYADDFILSVKGTKEQAVVIMDSIRSFFTEKLKLSLSAEKTRVVSLEQGFDFLGFRIQRVQLRPDHACVRIRPTQRNLSRLKTKMQLMLGPNTRSDDPQMKVAALNRVLRGWANYYKAVNAHDQFRTGDFLAWLLFQKWYCRKYQIGIRKYLSTVQATGRVVIRRGSLQVELFRMASNKSMHTSLNHQSVWKYRSIKNPYINATNPVTNIPEVHDNLLPDVPEVQPIAPDYDEVYLSNRLLAFERDGWKCIQCGSRDQLQAHHIEPIPKGQFNPLVIHRVDNLRTLCATCHSGLSRNPRAEIVQSPPSPVE